MKKIYTIFAIMALCTAAFTSCKEKEEPEVKPDDVEVVPGEQESTGYCFEAVIDEDFSDAQTKTTLGSESNNQVPVLWNATDKIVAIRDALYESEEAAFKDGDRERAVFNFASYPSSAPAFFAYPAANAPTYSNNTSIAITIPSPQEAVAGSFADNTAPAVGTIVNNKIVFKNAGALLKVRFGQSFSRQPIQSITLSCSSGDFSGSKTVTGSSAASSGTGSKTVTLTAPTGDVLSYDTDYYFVVWPGAKSGLTITVTDTDGKTASWTNSHELNPSRNDILTIAAFDIPLSKWDYKNYGCSEGLSIERVWGLYSTSSNAWCNASPIGVDNGNLIRSIAIDDQYIYMPLCQSTAAIKKYDYKARTAANMSTTNVESVGTFSLSCPRIVPNTNTNINGGKPVLAVCNMVRDGDGGNFRVYFYASGPSDAPTKATISGLPSSRRLGDKMTVYGTMSEGGLFFRDADATDGSVVWTRLAYSSAPTSLNIRRFTQTVQSAAATTGAFYPYPDGSYAKNGIHTTTGNRSDFVSSDTSPKDMWSPFSYSLTQTYHFHNCHGFSFFTFGGYKFIVYIQYVNSGHSVLWVHRASSEAGWQSIMEGWQDNTYYKAAIQNDTENNSITTSSNGSYSGYKAADCSVYVGTNEVYIAALQENVGLSLFRISKTMTDATGGTSGFPVETIDPGFEF